MIDYSLWEVIENGNAPPITKVVKGVETTIAPITAEEKAQRRLELEARSTLLMGIPNEHQLNFNSIKDAKSLLQAVKKSSEVLDQTFDRLQKFISQLKIHGESISQEDVNQKFLRSLSLEWNIYTIVWRNKPEIDILSLDDLYNNLKIYEPEVKGTSNSSTNIQNVAFVSSNSTSSTNGAVNTAHDYLEEKDLRWQMARFLKNTGRKLTINGNETIGFDKSKSDQAEEGPTNFALMAYSSTNSNSEVSTDSNCSSSCLENVKNLKKQNEQLLKDLRTSNLNAIAYKTSLESVEARLLVYKKNESDYKEDIKEVDI
ncbi:hypothetical protein Tco_0904648, partial [Tanacetum coccineum]